MYPQVTQFETHERIRRQHLALGRARDVATQQAGARPRVSAARRDARGLLLVLSLRKRRPRAST